VGGAFGLPAAGGKRAGTAVSARFGEALYLPLDPMAVVAGVVRRHDGEPAAGARVFAMVGEPRIQVAAVRESAADGSFRLPVAARASFQLVVQTEGHVADQRSVNPLEPGEVRRVEIELRAPSRIVGRLISSDSAVIAGADVAAHLSPFRSRSPAMPAISDDRAIEPQPAVSDADGAGEGWLDVPVAEGAVPSPELIVEAEGYRSLRRPLAPPVGTELELALEAHSSERDALRLRVRGPFGNTPERVWVTLLDAPGLAARTVLKMSTQGEVLVSELAPGRWRLAVSGDGSPAVALEVEVPGEAEVRLPLAGGLRVEVPQLVGSGRAVRLIVRDAHGDQPLGPAMPRAELLDGVAHLPQLAVGPWTVTVESFDGAPADRSSARARR
jgi:hypothetical protein